MANSITLIIANKFDYCTDIIIKWLKYYNKEFIVIDPEKKVLIDKIHINNQSSDILLNIDGRKLSLDEIESVIFWKGRIEFTLPVIPIESTNESLTKALDKFLNRELNTVTQYIYEELNKKKIFGVCITKNPNKLILLSLAKEVGLKIPDTVISSSLVQIRKEVSKKSTITKPIQEIFNYRTSTDIHTTFTHQCDTELFDNTEETIYPSLVQENIEKKYELRIFFYEEEFYSMAIFSQSDDKTKADFRDYNYENPNRMVPFNLPRGVQTKLKRFIDRVGFHSCSFDLIVNSKDEYIFLEVNPLGQFDLETIVCNYKIEKRVVEKLNAN